MVDLVQQYDPNAEGGKFDDLPGGKYEAQIVESRKQAVSKDRDNGDELVLGWQVTSGSFEKRMIWQRLKLWFTGRNAAQVVQIANTQFADIRKATGVQVPNNTDELHFIPCLLSYGPQKKSPQYFEVKHVAALGGTPVRQVASGVPAAAPGVRAPAQQQQAGATRPWAQRKTA